MTREEYKNFILKWNTLFPLDRWWRNKHKVAFLSEVHKQVSFFDQLMEFEEDKFFYELEIKKKEEKSESEQPIDKYIPNRGDWIKMPELKMGEEVSSEEEAFFLEEIRKMEEAAGQRKIESNG